MITAAPIAATLPLLDIQQKVRAYIVTAKVAAVDGLTWVEFGELLVALLRLVVELLDGVGTMTGPEKKALAMEAAAALFDAVADRAVPTVAWPFWLLVRPAVRSLVLAMADGAIEQILRLLRRT